MIVGGMKIGGFCVDIDELCREVEGEFGFYDYLVLVGFDLFVGELCGS